MNRVGMDIGGTHLRVALYADDGEQLAREAMPHDHSMGPRENLDRAVACVTFVVDPNRFVFGGSVALHNPGFVDLVCEHAKRYVLNPDMLDFALAECGGDAGLIGAALLV